MLKTGSCPSNKDWAQYIGGWATDLQMEILESHLQECDSCHQQLQELEQTGTDDSIVQNRLRGLKTQADDADSSFHFSSMNLEPADSVIQDRLQAIGHWSVPASHLRGWQNLSKIGQYDIVRCIGHGGMAQVYLARHRKLKRLMAIKLLHIPTMHVEEALLRLEREIEVVGGLNHSAIVAATDAGEIHGCPYLVTEFVDGLDLSRLARRMELQSQSIAVADACELVRQACLGMTYAHSQGVIHRDLKPSNLMLDRQGNLKILDFGLGQWVGQPEVSAELTSVGQLLGTLDYMAPEQAEDSNRADALSDLYSLGATLYRLLAGRAPYAATRNQSPVEKIRLLATATPPRLATLREDLPAELCDLVDRCLKRVPVERLPSVAHLAQELEPYCQDAQLIALVEQAAALPEPIDPSRSVGSPPGERAAFVGAPQPAASAIHGGSRRSGGGWFRWLLTGLFGFGFLLLGIVLILENRKGQLVIRSNDDSDITVRVLKDGQYFDDWKLQPGANAMRLYAGQYEIQLTGSADQFHIEGDKLELISGQTVVASIEAINSIADLGEGSSRESLQAAGDAKKLEQLCVQYRVQIGAYPTSLQDLVERPANVPSNRWRRPYLKYGVLPQDPWKQPFRLDIDESRNPTLVVWSIGPDGKSGTADDIASDPGWVTFNQKNQEAIGSELSAMTSKTPLLNRGVDPETAAEMADAPGESKRHTGAIGQVTGTFHCNIDPSLVKNILEAGLPELHLAAEEGEERLLHVSGPIDKVSGAQRIIQYLNEGKVNSRFSGAMGLTLLPLPPEGPSAERLEIAIKTIDESAKRFRRSKAQKFWIIGADSEGIRALVDILQGDGVERINENRPNDVGDALLPTAVLDEPIYEGKSYDHWAAVFKFERFSVEKAKALKAMLAFDRAKDSANAIVDYIRSGTIHPNVIYEASKATYSDQHSQLLQAYISDLDTAAATKLVRSMVGITIPTGRGPRAFSRSNTTYQHLVLNLAHQLLQRPTAEWENEDLLNLMKNLDSNMNREDMSRLSECQAFSDSFLVMNFRWICQNIPSGFLRKESSEAVAQKLPERLEDYNQPAVELLEEIATSSPHVYADPIFNRLDQVLQNWQPGESPTVAYRPPSKESRLIAGMLGSGSGGMSGMMGGSIGMKDYSERASLEKQQPSVVFHGYKIDTAKVSNQSLEWETRDVDLVIALVDVMRDLAPRVTLENVSLTGLKKVAAIDKETAESMLDQLAKALEGATAPPKTLKIEEDGTYVWLFSRNERDERRVAEPVAFDEKSILSPMELFRHFQAEHVLNRLDD